MQKSSIMESFTSHSICPFCYKSYSTSSSNNHVKNKVNTLVSKFFRSLDRFLNSTSSAKTELLPKLMCSKILNSCTSCLEILDGFCADYHKLKCIEMELEWKLERLVNVMKVAGRVPSRVKQLNGWFASSAVIKRENTNDSENTISYSVADFKRCRQKVIKRSTGRISKSQPRVSLKRNATYEADCISAPAVPRLMDDLRLPPEMNSSCSNPNSVLSNSSFPFSSANGKESVLTRSVVGQTFVRVDIPTTKLESQSLSPCDESSPTHSPSFGDIQIADPSCDNGEGDFQADDFGPFEMESKVDEPGEEVERISNVKFDSVFAFKKEPSPENYDFQTNRKRVNVKLDESEDKEESITYDNDVSSWSSTDTDTSSNSSISDGEYEKASQRKRDTPPACNSNNTKQSKILKCLARAKRANERTHQCSECDKAFKWKYKLRRHFKIHLGPDAWDFKCSICEKKFCTKHKLNMHIVTHNKDRNIFPCQFCSKTFPRNDDLSSHVRLDHIDKGDVGNKVITQCSECGEKFIGTRDLNVHIKTTHMEPPSYNCSDCGKSFRNKQNLKTHALIHKGPSARNLQCSMCGYMCYRKSSLNAHILTHNKPETLNCQFCEFVCQSVKALSVHVRSEHIEKGDTGDVTLIKCTQCDKKFIEERLLKKHVQQVHIEPSHQCSECGKIFKSKNQLTRHLRTHNASGTGKFRCTKCDYTCHQEHILKLHMIAHEKGKRLNCALCSSHFTSSNALTLHIRTEHIDKGDVGNYTVVGCSECDRKFISKKSMRQHMIKIHCARLHKCSECEKSFRTRGKLQIHCAIHQDPSTWRFACSECGKRFYRKGDMERHSMIYHERNKVKTFVE